jgi:hypothetical protein
LGVRSPDDLSHHPLRGPIFETFVVSEMRKLYLHGGQRPPLCFWRDSNGREVDLVVDAGGHRVPIEIKSAETVGGDFLKGLDTCLTLSGGSWGLSSTAAASATGDVATRCGRGSRALDARGRPAPTPRTRGVSGSELRSVSERNRKHHRARRWRQDRPEGRTEIVRD